MADIEIIFCVERGYFEYQAKLLVHSIRSLGGVWSEIPLFAYQPRKKYPITKATKRYFEEQSVQFIDLPLNKAYGSFQFINKSIICAYHEQHTSADQIIYLDCDILVWGAPELFGQISRGQVMIRPEDAKGAATNPGFSDENGAAWKGIYKGLGITEYPLIYTIRDYQQIVPYYNAGHLGAWRADGFYSQWNDNLAKALMDKWTSKRQLIFVDQMLVSATVTQMGMETLDDVGYNFPANNFLFDTIKHPAYQNVILKDMKTLHYHKILIRGQDPFTDHWGDTPRGKDLGERMKAFDLFRPAKVPLAQKLRRKLDTHTALRKYSA